MLTVRCPRCTQSFFVDETATHALCPNPICPALVHFAFFENCFSAEAFEGEHQLWHSTSLEHLADHNKWMVSYFREPILHYTTPSLSDLVPEEILQSIQAGFADYLGGPFTLFEVSDVGEHRRIEPLARKGNARDAHSMRESKFRNFARFCEVLRTYKSDGKLLGDTECHSTDCRVIDEIVSSGQKEASSHICWCGFVELTAPVVVYGRVLGVIFTGQKRHKDRIKQVRMKSCINKAARRLDLDAKMMTDLAYAEDVEEVDDNDIEIMKKDLNRIASQLQALATNEYRSRREAREGDFLDRVENVFTEAIDMISSDPLSIRPILETVLKGIRLFTGFPLAGTFLTVEDQPESLQYVAGNLWIEDVHRDPIMVESAKLRTSELRQTGPIVSKVASQRPLSIGHQLEQIAPGFRGGDALATCLVPIICSDCGGVLVLTSSHCEQNSSLDLHYVDSEPGIRFLTDLGHTISEHMGICLDAAKIKRDQVNLRHLMMSLGHEVNTPIQSMLADAANIVDELPADFEVRRIAEHNLEEVARLHLLSENIIAVLSERKKPKVQFTSHSIYRPISEACEMFEGEAAAKGCNIIGPRSVGSQFPVMEMSLFDLTLAFKNLIHNAVKYSFYPPKAMESERFIKVTGRWLRGEEGQRYAVEITNYGVGIKPEEIEKGLIFEPFYRGEWASIRHRTGSGLGLTLAKRVIEDMHGGQIQVQSLPMPGTAYLNVFTIILPISQDKREQEVTNA
ncbi:MAG: ATP-binding protein [Anaerolineae bacterium]